jgi:two-component sensor histidine kinase
MFSAVGSRTVRREFASTPGAVSDARHAVDGLYGELGPELHATTVLLISELVTNSVLHSKVPNGVIELVVCVTAAGVRVEVRDDGLGFDAAAPGRSHRDGGFGLKLVERLADRWSLPAGEGTRVRFEIDLREGVAAPAAATA